MFLESCRRARRGRGADEARHGNSGPRRSGRIPVPRRTLYDMAPDVLRPRSMACEIRRPDESSDEEMDTSTSSSSSTSSGDAASRPASVASRPASVVSRSASEARSGSMFSFNERHSGSGDNVSHVSTAVDPIGGPTVFSDAVPAGVQRPVASPNVNVDEVSDGSSVEEELPVYALPVTDDDDCSAYIPGSSVCTSPEIGSFRRCSRPIVSDDE